MSSRRLGLAPGRRSSWLTYALQQVVQVAAFRCLYEVAEALVGCGDQLGGVRRLAEDGDAGGRVAYL